MNKEYTYIDGKAIIVDENGNHIPVEYYDNLDDVLVQENVIETIEDRISYLQNESKEYKKINKKHYIPILFPLCMLATTIAVPAMFYWYGNTSVYVSTINTIFGPINEALFYSSFFSALFLPFAGFMELGMYWKHKDNFKKEKGINSELEFLEKKIIKEKERLLELKNKKTTIDDQKEFRVVKVDDLERIDEVEKWSNLYYDLGYDIEKYYNYYKNNKLDTKLGKYYDEDGIEAAKDFLEEKGPVLVRKRKTNSKK